jgi:chemotaxis protein CheC
MDDNIQLSELQRDTIIELLNIGMGQAGNSLSQMVNEEVQLSIPIIELLSRQQMSNRLKNELNRIAVVKQHFNGFFWGDALLLFLPEKSFELVRVLMKDNVPTNMLPQLEPDTLTEVGNIVIGACLSSLANVLTQELTSDLPTFMIGTTLEILDTFVHQTDEIIMFVRMDFALPTKNIDGYVAFVLEIPSVEQLKARIDKYLAAIGR